MIFFDFAIVYTSTGSTLYVDGVAIATETATAGSGALDDDSSYDLLIGNRSDSARDFDGYIGDLRIYDRALSAAEIKAIYMYDGHDGIVHSLISRWLFNKQAPGTTVSGTIADVGPNSNNGTPSNSPVFSADRLAFRRRLA